MNADAEGPLSSAVPEAVDEPEWRVRLRAAVERTARQRAARSEHRRALSGRRAAGMQARHAVRLARINDDLR